MTIEDSNKSIHSGNKSINLYKKHSILQNSPTFYPSPITINHWQLRDLIHSSSLNENEIFYPLNSTIQIFNLKNLKKKNYCEFDYNPRCFNELNGMIVAGGVSNNVGPIGSSKGLFSFYNFQTNINKTIRIGSLINNSVSIYHKSYNQYCSIICNNDESVYFVNINNYSINVGQSVKLNNSLNHSSLSPDQKSVICCGDCSNLYLLYPNTNERPKVIKTSCDSGFSTSFNPNGNQFSVCFQDGNNLIYDVRNTDSPIIEIHSTRQQNQAGAFRCVKYSQDTDDLLIISEHVGRIHLIDTRDFNNHQVVILPNSINFNNFANNNNDNNSDFLPSTSCSSSSSLSNIPTITSRSVKETTLNNEPLIFDYNYLSDNPKTFSFNHSQHLAGQLDMGTSNANANANAPSVSLQNRLQSIELENDYFDYSMSTAGGSSSYYGDPTELEVTGIDFISSDTGSGNSHLLIGSDKGIIKWKINSSARRCFPSYELV